MTRPYEILIRFHPSGAIGATYTEVRLNELGKDLMVLEPKTIFGDKEIPEVREAMDKVLAGLYDRIIEQNRVLLENAALAEKILEAHQSREHVDL